MKISIKLRVFSDRLFVSRRGGGVHWGSDGEGGGQQRGGGGGAIVGGGGSTVGGGGCRQPIRTALHNISISFQNSLSKASNFLLRAIKNVDDISHIS